MTDIPAAPSKMADLEGMDLLALDTERQRLLGGRDSLDVLTEEELERYIAINHKMRLTARTAGKPPKDGTAPRGRPLGKMSLSDLLKRIDV